MAKMVESHEFHEWITTFVALEAILSKAPITDQIRVFLLVYLSGSETQQSESQQNKSESQQNNKINQSAQRMFSRF